ncbi:uncharacterized protein CIMG_08757 [Coccidioides immitis RS]|uniref:Uncharacterized protein n=1 Tax=Coccidioides immitis (strain RS) TaxID=246410 RepID=J3K650_COCIM|nr:uncharacterized protein CIMG_08757 [Coccidioides immitis RS]EAS30011.3 hypothetical protein CIMG_08757 [Coccidioides immitis RS]
MPDWRPSNLQPSPTLHESKSDADLRAELIAPGKEKERDRKQNWVLKDIRMRRKFLKEMVFCCQLIKSDSKGAPIEPVFLQLLRGSLHRHSSIVFGYPGTVPFLLLKYCKWRRCGQGVDQGRSCMLLGQVKSAVNVLQEAPDNILLELRCEVLTVIASLRKRLTIPSDGCCGILNKLLAKVETIEELKKKGVVESIGPMRLSPQDIRFWHVSTVQRPVKDSLPSFYSAKEVH